MQSDKYLEKITMVAAFFTDVQILVKPRMFAQQVVVQPLPALSTVLPTRLLRWQRRELAKRHFAGVGKDPKWSDTHRVCENPIISKQKIAPERYFDTTPGAEHQSIPYTNM